MLRTHSVLLALAVATTASYATSCNYDNHIKDKDTVDLKGCTTLNLSAKGNKNIPTVKLKDAEGKETNKTALEMPIKEALTMVEALRKSSITEIDASGTKFDWGVFALALAVKPDADNAPSNLSKNLQTINLSNAYIDDYGVLALQVAFQENKATKSLNLSGNTFEEMGFEAIKKLATYNVNVPDGYEVKAPAAAQ